jgi:endoglucanase
MRLSILSLLLVLPVPAAEPAFNYAETQQKTLYFYEAQQSGALSPNNRVEWRGPLCLTDGQDLGRDLSGGWFDAGDHWTANLTMSFAAVTLAWSAVEQPDGWLKTGQMGIRRQTPTSVADLSRRKARRRSRALKYCSPLCPI